MKKRDFRENAILKRGLDLSFVWCSRAEFVAIINHDVGKHAGACVPAFPRGRTPFTEGCEPFFRGMGIPVPRDGNLLPRDGDLFSG